MIILIRLENNNVSNYQDIISDDSFASISNAFNVNLILYDTRSKNSLYISNIEREKENYLISFDISLTKFNKDLSVFELFDIEDLSSYSIDLEELTLCIMGILERIAYIPDNEHEDEEVTSKEEQLSFNWDSISS